MTPMCTPLRMWGRFLERDLPYVSTAHMESCQLDPSTPDAKVHGMATSCIRSSSSRFSFGSNRRTYAHSEKRPPGSLHTLGLPRCPSRAHLAGLDIPAVPLALYMVLEDGRDHALVAQWVVLNHLLSPCSPAPGTACAMPGETCGGIDAVTVYLSARQEMDK